MSKALKLVQQIGVNVRGRQVFYREGDANILNANQVVGDTNPPGSFVYEPTSKRSKQAFNNNAASKTVLFGSYKTSSKKRKIKFELTKEQFIKLTSSDCHYCGEKPSQKFLGKRLLGRGIGSIYYYNGIDRLDPKKGYEIGNVVSCCKKCNFAKQSMSYEEFIKWIKSVYKKICGSSATITISRW